MLSEQSEIILLLIFATRQRNLLQLQPILSRLATFRQNNAISILAQAKRFLSQSEQDWLEGSMKMLYHDPENVRNLRCTAWLWVFHKEGEPLNQYVPTKLSMKDKKALQARAQSEGVSQSELVRKAVRAYLNAQIGA